MDQERATSDPAANKLAEEQYLASRLAPSLGDVDFLILKDLLGLVREFAVSTHGRVFDYGCGGAPYRGLFRHCTEYRGADIHSGPRVDQVLTEDGMTGEDDASYDAVLSSQVLEHVRNPAAYLRECLRILKPEGRLLLSTHGMFHEHGCPHDYHRWTAPGLNLAVANAGFRIERCVKLTTGIRGIFQMLHYLMARLRAPESPFWHFLFGLLRKSHACLGVPVLNALASRFECCGVQPESSPASIYIGVAVIAVKPAGAD